VYYSLEKQSQIIGAATTMSGLPPRFQLARWAMLERLMVSIQATI
jgi:hypothetical protein